MTTRDDSPNPQPVEPNSPGGGGTPEPAPETIQIPPKIVTYIETDLGTRFDVQIDMNIKTRKE